jgi:alpha-L-fucosidase
LNFIPFKLLNSCSMKKPFTLALFVLFAFSHAQDKMSWFEEAKLGIFIHWGIYAVDGISESWSFYNGYLSHEDYMKQLSGFTAEKYQPKDWVKLISNSGAKYTVITSKHHDGFALWNSKHGNLNAFSSAKAQKDVLTPFVKAVRKSGLKLGMYFSLPDWSYEDYTHHTNKIRRYQIANDSLRWNRYLSYMNAQLDELSQNYTPDLWWFDGDWEHSSEEWRVDEIKTKLIAQNKNSIFNSRLNGKGDYETPEIGIPVMAPRSKHWELCVSINDSWGYQPNDNNYKTPMQVIDLFVDTLSKGGNLLLNISPKADGSIPNAQKNVLNELGAWIKKHQSAVYTTQRGIPYEHFYGPTTLSKDRKTLYLYLRDIPKDGNVVLKGISTKINRAYVVGQGAILNQQTICTVYWNKYPGLTYIEVPKESIDPYYTVIAVLLDGEIELYREHNGAVEQN